MEFLQFFGIFSSKAIHCFDRLLNFTEVSSAKQSVTYINQHEALIFISQLKVDFPPLVCECQNTMINAITDQIKTCFY